MIEAQSEIPTRCGLGSSGAISAAFALLLDMFAEGDPTPLERWRSLTAQELAADRRFKRVFQDACEFERVIHFRSSGVGPFASLIGSSQGSPVLYQCEEIPASGPARAHLEQYERLPEDQARRWRNEFSIADIYSGVPRMQARGIIKGVDYWKRLEKGRKHLTYVTENLWHNISTSDWHDVVVGFHLYREYEAGFLKIMTPPEPEVIVRLCGYFDGLRVGAKYSGAGRGGDLILAGSPKAIMQALIPNYFPVHFADFLVPKNNRETVSHTWMKAG